MPLDTGNLSEVYSYLTIYLFTTALWLSSNKILCPRESCLQVLLGHPLPLLFLAMGNHPRLLQLHLHNAEVQVVLQHQLTQFRAWDVKFWSEVLWTEKGLVPYTKVRDFDICIMYQWTIHNPSFCFQERVWRNPPHPIKPDHFWNIVCP